jgi:hypothetical protein
MPEEEKPAVEKSMRSLPEKQRDKMREQRGVSFVEKKFRELLPQRFSREYTAVNLATMAESRGNLVSAKLPLSAGI